MLSSDHIELLAAEGNGTTANKMSVTTGIAYQKLLKTVGKLPTAQRSLNNLPRVDGVDWAKVYMLPRQVTIESSLCSLEIVIGGFQEMTSKCHLPKSAYPIGLQTINFIHFGSKALFPKIKQKYHLPKSANPIRLQTVKRIHFGNARHSPKS